MWGFIVPEGKNDLEIKMFAWDMVAMILISAIDKQRPVVSVRSRPARSI